PRRQGDRQRAERRVCDLPGDPLRGPDPPQALHGREPGPALSRGRLHGRRDATQREEGDPLVPLAPGALALAATGPVRALAPGGALSTPDGRRHPPRPDDKSDRGRFEAMGDRRPYSYPGPGVT